MTSLAMFMHAFRDNTSRVNIFGPQSGAYGKMDLFQYRVHAAISPKMRAQQ